MHDVSETQLLQASLAGDKDAFGTLVLRYQALVCSITYSATGDLARSQELAQETFLKAWKSLRQLREPDKFRPWLCRIARNVVNRAVRRRQFDVVHTARPLDRAATVEAPRSDPGQAAVDREHERLVWQALEGIPETYREPLILFYRRRQSIRQVAQDLDLSEDAVKQRLSRGRRMLRTEVASLVEGVLGRTSPGKAFTVAVVAALPALTPQTAAAGLAAGAAKGSPAAKGAFATGLSGAILGPLLGLLGGVMGSWAGITNTKSPRERAFMIKMTAAIWMALILLIGVPLTFSLAGWIPKWAGWTCFAVFFALLIPAIAWSNNRQHRIQQEDGTCAMYHEPCPETRRFTCKCRRMVLIEVISLLLIIGLLLVLLLKGIISRDAYATLFFVAMAIHMIAAIFHIKWVKHKSILIDQVQERRQKPVHKAPPAPQPRSMTKGAIHGALGGGTIGAVAWIIVIATITRDWLAAAAVIIVAAAIFLWGARACLRDQSRHYRILIRMLALLGALNLLAINLRWEYWMEIYRKTAMYEPVNDVPRWTLNLIMTAVIGGLIVAMIITDRTQRRNTPPSTP